MATLVRPEAAGGDDPAPLSPAQVERWRTTGHVLVDGLLPDDLIDDVVAFADQRFPAVGTPEATRFRQFGSAVVFPTINPATDGLALHPRLLGAVAQVLGRTPGDLRLTQCDLWPKYGRSADTDPVDRYDNDDQRIHVDYPNHMLAHPTPWDRPSAVELIVYLSDHDDSGGSTAVVPRLGDDDPLYPWPIVGSPGIGELPWINDRARAEAHLADVDPELAAFRQALYEREVHTTFRPGSVLLYRHDTWHRGTPLRPGTARVAQNLTYRLAECDWVDTLHVGWSWSMYRPDQYLERLLGSATVDQRTVLGFPAPGSAYWCPRTVEAVTARYGAFGFDPTPYLAALTD
jgi:hypothetical protein